MPSQQKDTECLANRAKETKAKAPSIHLYRSLPILRETISKGFPYVSSANPKPTLQTYPTDNLSRIFFLMLRASARHVFVFG